MSRRILVDGSEVHQFLRIEASWVCTRGTASRTQKKRFFSPGQCWGVIAAERRRNRRIGGLSLAPKIPQIVEYPFAFSDIGNRKTMLQVGSRRMLIANPHRIRGHAKK